MITLYGFGRIFPEGLFSRLSPFHQAPVIDDAGVVVAESAAVVLYLADKSGKLILGTRRATRAHRERGGMLTPLAPPSSPLQD
jgi:glutathione S-transferase